MTRYADSHLLLSCAVAGAVASLCLLADASAQSLGDVARQEQTRRQAVSRGKVYTNENLPNVAPSSPLPSRAAQADAPAAGQAEPAPPADAAPAGTADGDGDVKNEAYWRERIAAERDALARAESFAEALQSRINALSTDFVNRDDPAQRNVIAGDRDKALAELERVRKEIQDHTRAIGEIQQEARRAGVPAGWVR
jgi:hypothetical protein